jgi:hypothetical protein
MDVEAELIRSSNWAELKRYYSSKAGHSWELAWVHLLKTKDLHQAIEQFTKALNDPRYEESSHIMLWRLGKRPSMIPLEGPPSLRVYDAFVSGRSGPLLHYLESSSSHSAYLPFLFRNLLQKMSIQDLSSIEKFPRPASFSLLMAEVYDRRLKDFEKAKTFYQEFLSDPWTKNVIDENRRNVFDAESSRKLRMAYAQKDGSFIKKSLQFLLKENEGLQTAWSKALVGALHYDLRAITQNILGFPFWKETELSPQALQSMRENLFSPEELLEPPPIKFWTEFFTSSKLIDIPASLDPDSLSLWQIRVEMKSEVLSEALLRFPQEERFLFLWSLRQREKFAHDPRRWPADEKESSVVRKSLERAFERSTNKVLWFDRLRASGCSQDFYEYAVQRVAIPIRWVIEDLEKNFISNSPIIRAYLRDQLSIAAPTDSSAHLLEPNDFLKAVSFLTPAEKQQVLLSRYVLSEVPQEVLNEEAMDLFFEARGRVGPEVFKKWQDLVLDRLAAKPRHLLSPKDWRWVELGWEGDPEELERFSPNLDSKSEFPWASYLERLEAHKKFDLVLTILPQVTDERLKESWIVSLLEEFQDPRIYRAIQSLKTEHIRSGLLATWYEKKRDPLKALEHRELELAASPILNEQVRVLKTMIELLKLLPAEALSENISRLEEVHQKLELCGALDENLFRDLAELYARTSHFDKAFQVTVTQWNRSSHSLREDLLATLLQRAFQARSLEAAQRLLIDYVFEFGKPDALTYEILGTLLDSESVFRIRHLRKEFVERASQLFPLHREVLKSKSTYDYRAFLLWESFYGEDLEQRAQLPAYDHKRRYELWRFTESMSHVESASIFAKYLNISSKAVKPVEKEAHEFLEKARRLTLRLAKSYGFRKGPEIVLAEELPHPFCISFKPFQFEVKRAFFEELDEEMWTAMAVGSFQLFDDFDKGLFDEKHLMERFFQGMLLSGAPIAKLIRLWVWLAIHEGLIEPTLLQTDPETLIERLPFINSLLIFYLGQDFDQKMHECALPLA